MGKIYHVDLHKTEQEALLDLIVKRDSKSEVVKRSYILLAADRKGTKQWKDTEIASVYGVSLRTVERVRCCFVEEGLEIALKGRPRLYKKERIFDGRVESQLVALRCSEPQEIVPGRVGWTLRLLSEQMVALDYVESMSHETVRQILKKTKLSLGK